MENTTLMQIVGVCRGRYSGPEDKLSHLVPDLMIDSRLVTPGSIFIAFPGEHVDGHDYIMDAYAKGALAAIGTEPPPDPERPYIKVTDGERALGDIARWYRKRFTGPLIAVSGSVGKTTTKEMIAAALSPRYRVFKTPGNYNNSLGLPLTIFKLSGEYDAAVLELGINHFGEMRYLAEIARPTAAVLTNIGDAHLEALGSREGVLKAKTEMLDFLAEGATVYVNGDDPLLSAYQPPQGIRQVLFGRASGAVRATQLRLDEQGVTCCINDSAFNVHAEGEHLVYAMLAAYAVAHDLGCSDAEIATGLSSYRPLAGRGLITLGARCRVIDHSYNGNPSSMQAALNSLALFPHRRVAILGDMFELGEDSRALHAKVGAWAAKAADLLIAIGPLSEQTYAAALEAGGSGFHFVNAKQAIEHLDQLLRPGDTVLVKASNGMHLSEVAKAAAELE